MGAAKTGREKECPNLSLIHIFLFAGLAVQTAIQIGRNGIHGPVAHTKCGLHLALTLYITITMVCYWALLSWQSFSMAGVKISQLQMKLSHFILHTAVPIFALVDWMLFLPHGRVRPRAAVYFLAYPIAYSTVSYTHLHPTPRRLSVCGGVSVPCRHCQRRCGIHPMGGF